LSLRSVNNIDFVIFFLQQVLQSRGYIYRGKYEGWYCISDEAFLSDDDVIEVAGDRGTKLHVSLIMSNFFCYPALIFLLLKYLNCLHH